MRTMPSQQHKNTTNNKKPLQNKKNHEMHKALASLLYKILTLNNAFASLSNDCCLGTLNLNWYTENQTEVF
jgi:hypothetical protein